MIIREIHFIGVSIMFTQKVYGMDYISHKPEDHESWKEEKNQRYGKNKRYKINDFTSPPKFSLSDKMKAALVTKCKMEPNQIENMLNDSSLN